ncbi:hypothetical protein GCM10027597_38860 [Saccharopolyspora tripterygii]
MDSERMDNFVVPVVNVEVRCDELSYKSLAGTAFLLAEPEGIALTARHVAEQIKIGEVAVLFIRESGWQAAAVTSIELHPTEDVAALRLEDGSYPSPFTLSRIQEYASCQYMLWGYPDAVLHEIVVDGRAFPRPSLVYSEGHIRRRLTDVPLERPEGHRFYELSAVAGAGCSGSPITDRRPGFQWGVVGIYVGERRSDSGDLSVGYATRLAEIDEGAPSWWSRLFGIT